jgi:hypothetical protein
VGFGVVALSVGSLAKFVAFIVLMFLMAASIAALVLVKWVRERKIYPKEPLNKL